MASLYKQQVVDFLKARNYKARQVLDVGGGDTGIRKYTNVETNRLLVLDNNDKFKPDFIHDLNEFKHPDEIFATERNPQFDLIFCMNVFEYIWNPYNAVANLYTWLETDGKLVINFPFLYPMHEPAGTDYLRYTHEWVQQMFQSKFKFSTIDIHMCTSTKGKELLKAFYINEKMHMRKNDDSWNIIGCIVEVIK